MRNARRRRRRAFFVGWNLAELQTLSQPRRRIGRMLMRPWAISLVGALAFSVVIPATSDARARFGPAAVLGAMTAPLGLVLGGVHHGFGSRHHTRGENARAYELGSVEHARAEPVISQPVAPVQLIAGTRPEHTAVFWPYAADDLVEYVF